MTQSKTQDSKTVAREIVETINKTAISLAVCRHSLIREGEDDEYTLPDEAEDEIIQDVLDCLTGEETGCLDPEELSPENCALLMVQDRLDRAATQMRDACVEKVKELTEEHRLKLQFGTGATGQRCRDRIRFSNEIVTALSSLTLDQVKQKEQSK